MGKIVISGPQNVSLDGVVQDPDGKPDAGTTAVRILDQIMEQLR